MRKLTKFFKFLIVPLLIIIGTVSCNKNELEVAPLNTGQSNTPKITTNQLGFLEFKDIETFKQTVKELKALTPEKRIAWEKEYNFISLKSIYQEVLRDETKLLSSLKIDFKNNDKINANQFPNIHSDMFEKYKSSIVSTGEKLTDIPQANIGAVDYASAVNKDGIVKINNGLFQFKKGIVKVMKIGEIVNINDINNLVTTEKSNDKVKIFDSSYKNKNAKIAQSGNAGTLNLINNDYIVISTIGYSDQYVFADPSTPGAFHLSFLGINIWIAPAVVYNATMHVHNVKFWYHSESDMRVLMTGNVNGAGRTDYDGNFQASNIEYGVSINSGVYYIRQGYYIYPDYFVNNGILAGEIRIDF